MKFLLSFLLLFSPLFAVEMQQDEIALLQELIAATKKNLNDQERLLKNMVAFKQLRTAFIAEPTNGKLATKLVKSAMTLQTGLESAHLLHLFSSDFLTELAFFNQVGNQSLSRE